MRVVHCSTTSSFLPPFHSFCILSDHTSMADTAVSPPAAISPTKPSAFPSAGRNAPAANGHYVNGSATASDATSERMQVINDEKEFRCGSCAKTWNLVVS